MHPHKIAAQTLSWWPDCFL